MRRLGELEAVIMHQMWERDAPVSVREVMESITAERQLAYTTVMTVMDNLFRKEMLTREMHRRAYLYAPALTQAEYSAGLIAAVVDESGDRTAALLQFMDQLSPAELRKIREAMDAAVKVDPGGLGRRLARRGRK